MEWIWFLLLISCSISSHSSYGSHYWDAVIAGYLRPLLKTTELQSPARENKTSFLFIHIWLILGVLPRTNIYSLVANWSHLTGPVRWKLWQLDTVNAKNRQSWEIVIYSMEGSHMYVYMFYENKSEFIERSHCSERSRSKWINQNQIVGIVRTDMLYQLLSQFHGFCRQHEIIQLVITIHHY